MIESSRPIRTIIGQYANYVLAALPLRNFLPKVTMSITKGEFLIKTAENWKDVESVLKLRYEVFLREGLNLNFPLGMDVDRWDPLADHLMVIDTRNQALIGTYRLVSSSFSNDFYSASEFELAPFLRDTLGGKLELSRACIRAEYRSTAAISLLWRGIASYANVVGARYLFGCASIKSMDRHVADTLLDYFKGEGLYEEKAGVHPLPSFQMAAAVPRTEPAAPVNVREMIPPLLGSYLRAGAKVLCEPALDRSFKCLDFLTVLDFANINKAFERRYLSS
jgi:putative hemolysin